MTNTTTTTVPESLANKSGKISKTKLDKWLSESIFKTAVSYEAYGRRVVAYIRLPYKEHDLNNDGLPDILVRIAKQLKQVGAKVVIDSCPRIQVQNVSYFKANGWNA